MTTSHEFDEAAKLGTASATSPRRFSRQTLFFIGCVTVAFFTAGIWLVLQRGPRFNSVSEAIEQLDLLLGMNAQQEAVEVERWILSRGSAAIPELKAEFDRCHQECQERMEKHRQAFHSDVRAHTRSGFRYFGPGPLDRVQSDPVIKSLQNRGTLCGYFLEMQDVNELPGFEWVEKN